MQEDLPTLLLTGFEPFGGDTTNPSALVATALQGRLIEARTPGAPVPRARVQSLVLPCCFAEAPQALAQALQQWQPLAVLALGLAAGRAALTPERVAVNLADARIADNAGAQPRDEAVLAGGPAAYFSTLPVKAMVAAMQSVGAPAALSLTAGSFVCNQVFYRLMHQLALQPGVQAGAQAVRGGFMHLPLLPEQAAGPAGQAPSLPLALQVAAVQAALAAVLEHREDLALPGGAES
jgi:pyroglutamyl-peptidase